MLNEYVNIQISNINTEVFDMLQYEYNHYKGFKVLDNSIQISFLGNDFSDELINVLYLFFDKLDSKKKKYKLNSNCSFNKEEGYLICSGSKVVLTYKESMFLKMILLCNENFMSYEYMQFILWKEKDFVSKNAIRQFVKDFKKKLPDSIELVNIYHSGYKLIL